MSDAYFMPIDVIDDWEIVGYGYYIISNISAELDTVDEFAFFIMKMLPFHWIFSRGVGVYFMAMIGECYSFENQFWVFV